MIYMSSDKNVRKKENDHEKFDIDKQDFWLLVKSAYKVILPFVFLIIVIYFLFTLFLTEVVL
ncbi:polysaccharide biosynthesis protein [Candidatus Arthromitus sp. SFB-turkey]|nr:polysaccharide biosynthesis protein [Candidatus Arthromitus sp. SFB-turkey]